MTMAVKIAANRWDRPAVGIVAEAAQARAGSARWARAAAEPGPGAEGWLPGGLATSQAWSRSSASR